MRALREALPAANLTCASLAVGVSEPGELTLHGAACGPLAACCACGGEEAAGCVAAPLCVEDEAAARLAFRHAWPWEAGAAAGAWEWAEAPELGLRAGLAHEANCSSSGLGWLFEQRFRNGSTDAVTRFRSWMPFGVYHPQSDWALEDPWAKREELSRRARTDLDALVIDHLLPRAERFNREADGLRVCFWSDDASAIITYTILSHLFAAAILSFCGMAAMVVCAATPRTPPRLTPHPLPRSRLISPDLA